MTTVTKPQLRWSSTRNCPRLAVYEVTELPERDWTLSEERIMWRGQGVGHDFAVRLAVSTMEAGGNGLVWLDSAPDPYRRWPDHLLATSREYAGFVVERKVPWLGGVGHVDVYATETDTVIEVLSSRYPTQAHSKLLQAIGYGLNIPECKAVCLVIVDPSDLSEERVIVTRGSDEWQMLATEAYARLDQINRWQETGAMPGRVCSKPSEARGHWCRYSTVCFEGWEPEPLAALDDPTVRELAVRLAHAKTKEREVKATLKVIEDERKQIQESLAEVVEPGVWQSGAVKLTRSDRHKDSFKLTLAREDSRLPADLLAEFTSRAEFSVWDATIVADESNADFGVDFGDEAPW